VRGRLLVSGLSPVAQPPNSSTNQILFILRTNGAAKWKKRKKNLSSRSRGYQCHPQRATGVVDEKWSEYILAHTGPRELDGDLGGCGSFFFWILCGFGLVPGYTTLSVRVWANILFGALKIKKCETERMYLTPLAEVTP